MLAVIAVVTALVFLLREPEFKSPAERGRFLIASRLDCNSCHANILRAPSLDLLVGKQRPLVDGSLVTIDEAYVRRALLEPAAEVAQGFQAVMPKYALNEQDLNDVVAALLSPIAPESPQ
jgi:cytochrome c oxidase subunit 2